jgi:hypothetical protein
MHKVPGFITLHAKYSTVLICASPCIFMIQQYLFQQMHNLVFIYDKLGLHISAYQAIIRAPITKNTENTASQNKHKKTLKVV